MRPQDVSTKEDLREYFKEGIKNAKIPEEGLAALWTCFEEGTNPSNLRVAYIVGFTVGYNKRNGEEIEKK